MILAVITTYYGDDDNISKIKMFHKDFHNKMAQPTILKQLFGLFMSFENWKIRFSKTYPSKEEESKRKLIFEANVQNMIEHNEKISVALCCRLHVPNQT